MADNIFDELNDGTSEVEKKEEPKKNTKKNGIGGIPKAELESAWAEFASSTPNVEEIINANSDKVSVINTYGYSDSGNIKEDKTDGKRSLVPISKIVGYKVKLSEEAENPMTVTVDKWIQDKETGIFVAKKVEKKLLPGETMDITRKDFTVFTSDPTISFRLKNGSVRKSSAVIDPEKNPDEFYAGFYFVFSSGEPSVNDESIKINVGEKDDSGEWIVKKEFIDTFGFLMNPGPAKAGRQKKNDIQSGVNIMAAYINKLAKKK